MTLFSDPVSRPANGCTLFLLWLRVRADVKAERQIGNPGSKGASPLSRKSWIKRPSLRRESHLVTAGWRRTELLFNPF